MRLIKTEDAVGHVLCHDMTQIIKDQYKDARFRKGHVVTEEDIPVLLSMGKEHLYVWEMTSGMVHENDAAERLLALCGQENMIRSGVKEGKIELKAACDGVFLVDSARLVAVNSQDEVMIATRKGGMAVREGDKLAGMRVIPLVIEEEKLRKAEQAAGDKPLLSLKPYVRKTACIVATGGEVKKGLIKDTFTPVVIDKLKTYGIETLEVVYSGDGVENVRDAVLAMRGKKPDTLWVNKRVVKCPEEVAQQLAVEAGSDVFLLKRIRYVDEEAVSIEESWVPAHLIHDVDAIGISLYDYFRSQHIYPQRTRSRVSARMPDAEFQSHIQLDSKIPVLVIKQVALDQQQRPIEYSISHCRSDLYVFVCEE